MNTLIPNTLLEVGDSYVYASWTPEGSDEQVLAILRDSDQNGSWSLEQPQTKKNWAGKLYDR